MQEHRERVRLLSAQIKKLYETQKPFRIFHGSTNSTRILSFQKDQLVDISQLNSILSIDTDTRIAYVEPNVPMDTLVKSTLKNGLIPPVVMEFPGITVGGGIQGGGGESSSFRWGCFNQTCTSYEMILANGDVVQASPAEHADLFHATAGSSGTLGVLTAASIRLIPAKRYVQLTYTPVHSFDEAKSITEHISKQSVDFLDGIMFSSRSGVIISGVLSDEPNGAVVRFSRPHDPWYYVHVEKSLGKANGRSWIETVPIVDYLFRYDRGAFWVGKFAFDMFGVPFNRLTRWLLDPILHTRKLYQALQESGASQRHVVQDLILPADTLPDFMQKLDDELHIYPLWLCPLKPDPSSPFQLNHLETDSIINIGVWGPELPSYERFLAANRFIEHLVLKANGRKWSYGHSYFSSEEFWQLYDKPTYDELRRKYHAETLPSMYDKLTVTKQFPINRKKGLLRTIFGTAKLKISR